MIRAGLVFALFALCVGAAFVLAIMSTYQTITDDLDRLDLARSQVLDVAR